MNTYWKGLSDDFLDQAGVCIRQQRWQAAIDALKGALRCANRAKDMSRSGRCCAAIKRLHWLLARVPAAPQPWKEAA